MITFPRFTRKTLRLKIHALGESRHLRFVQQSPIIIRFNRDPEGCIALLQTADLTSRDWHHKEGISLRQLLHDWLAIVDFELTWRLHKRDCLHFLALEFNQDKQIIFILYTPRALPAQTATMTVYSVYVVAMCYQASANMDAVMRKCTLNCSWMENELLGGKFIF